MANLIEEQPQLIRFRNEYPAFDGLFRVENSDDSVLALSWEKDRSRCELRVNFMRDKAEIRYAWGDGTLTTFPL